MRKFLLLILAALILTTVSALASDPPFNTYNWEKPYLPTRLELLKSLKAKVDHLIDEVLVDPLDDDIWNINTVVWVDDGWCSSRIDFTNQYWQSNDGKSGHGPEGTIMLEAIRVGVDTLIERELKK